MFSELISKVLAGKEVVFFASANKQAVPNVAPKVVVKIDGNFVYLVDFLYGRTWENLKDNPRGAVSFQDERTLNSYVMRGEVVLITAGKEFENIIQDLERKQVSIAVERVVQGIKRGIKHADVAFFLPENGVVMRMRVEEVVEITPQGKLKHEKG